jgi:hypothetical protein
VSGDDLAALLYLATSHPDEFVRCACAARALELRDMPVTEASVARTAKIDDRELAGDVDRVARVPREFPRRPDTPGKRGLAGHSRPP